MPEIELTPQAQESQSQALMLAEQAGAVVVKDAQTYIVANEFRIRIKLMRDKVKEIFEGPEGMKTLAHLAHKNICKKMADIDGPLEIKERWIKGQMEQYDARKREEARKEEQRLAEEARKAQEDRVLEAAVQAEKSGDTTQANLIIETPVQPVAVVIPKDVPKLENGPVFRTVWKFRYVDVNNRPIETPNIKLIPVEYHMIDEKKLNKIASAGKGTIKVPGVEFYSERV